MRLGAEPIQPSLRRPRPAGRTTRRHVNPSPRVGAERDARGFRYGAGDFFPMSSDREKAASICSAKVRFGTQGAAERAIRRLRGRRSGTPRLRVYRCPVCSGFHATKGLPEHAHEKARVPRFRPLEDDEAEAFA